MGSHSIKTWWSRNGSVVLFIVSQICAVTAPILASKATPKASEAVDQYKAEHLQKYMNEHDTDEEYIEPTKMELIKAGCYNSFIPVIGVAATGIVTGGMAFARQESDKKALFDAYNAASKTEQYLTDALKENVSKDKFNKIKSEAAKRECEDIDPKKLPESVDTSNLSWFKDSWSGQVFRGNIETIRQVRNDINEILNNEGRAPLNEWYVHLINCGCEGISLVELGWAVGWEASVPYQNLDVDIDVTQLSDGTPCGVITFRPKPKRF